MASRVCGVCGHSFHAPSVAEVQRLQQHHRLEHHSDVPAAAAPAPAPEPPRVLERVPNSSARVSLTTQLVLDFASDEEAARAGHALGHDSLFLPLEAPRHIGTQVQVIVTVGTRAFQLGGVVVAAYPDPADPHPTAHRHGNGVFLTSASPGWSAFCDGLASGFHDLTDPDRTPLVESRRTPVLNDFDPFEFDDESTS